MTFEHVVKRRREEGKVKGGDDDKVSAPSLRKAAPDSGAAFLFLATLRPGQALRIRDGMEFIAFDLETTGIQPKTDAIVEIGAVRFDGAEPVETFCTLVNPGRPIPPEASAVNGISDEMVAGSPAVETVLTDLAAFCGDLPLVAHNAPFDFKFLLNAVEAHKAKAPSGVVLDSCALSRVVFPEKGAWKKVPV